ncbi:hypothetical protein RhiirA4_430742 [Rhizophagus irregularis]|uniref:Uncharacterized protein n=1 Tax=Rhizophagus irregularis TaxID=588596 RepID=A0A2I1HM08_9GLOM|nr:hypothetical protein RhiirA4_430742 [Rhizophagus irregularis]
MNYDLSVGKFSKILKKSKNWKIIAYLKDQKSMEQAVERSIANGNIEHIWKVRNLKEIYRGEKKQEKKVGLQKVDKEKMEEKLKTNDEEKLNEPLLEKSFSELDDSSKYQNTKSINKGHGKSTALTNEVVDTINRYKKGVEEEVDQDNKVMSKR